MAAKDTGRAARGPPRARRTSDPRPRGGAARRPGVNMGVMVRRPIALLAVAGMLAAVFALTALTGGRFTSYSGGDGSLTVSPGRWWTLWAVPPLEVIAILAGVGYLALGARRRGALTQGLAWTLASGAALLLISVCSPLAGLSQGGILAAHMLQHTLIGAFAPAAILMALPRRIRGEGPPPHPVLRALGHPVAAFLLWAGLTVVWLLPAIHHPVLEHETLWVAQQFAFFATGCLLWMPVLERGVDVPAWFGTGAKVFYMVGVWFVGVIIANVYWFSGTAFYASHANAARVWGLDPLADQANAGTVMVTMHCFLTLTAVTWLFFRQAHESGLAQRLRDAGVDDTQVDDALRRGELDDLARRRGVPVTVRAGID